LSLNAKVLIMDEPTSSLTLTETEQLLKIVDDPATRALELSIYLIDSAK